MLHRDVNLQVLLILECLATMWAQLVLGQDVVDISQVFLEALPLHDLQTLDAAALGFVMDGLEMGIELLLGLERLSAEGTSDGGVEVVALKMSLTMSLKDVRLVVLEQANLTLLHDKLRFCTR